MKCIKFVLIMALGSGAAFADGSRTGDMANYRVENVSFQANIEYGVGYYDISEDAYELRRTTVINGSSDEQLESIKRSELMTHEQAQQILEFCADIDGVIETLSINGVAHNTCRLAVESESFQRFAGAQKLNQLIDINSDGYAWIGDFPVFGIGRLHNKDITLQLNRYRWSD